MPKLIVIAGHGAGDPGAVRGPYAESELVRKLAAKIKELGGEDVYLYDTAKNCVQETKAGHGAYELAHLGLPVVELHMDAAAETARGAHIRVYKKSDTTNAQNTLKNALVKLLPGRFYSVVQDQSLLNCSVFARYNIEYALCENGFISNTYDRGIFEDNLERIAKYYLEAYGIEEKHAPAKDIPVNAQWIMQQLGDGKVAFENVAFPGNYLSLNATEI